jgi:hypothetical protein
MLTPTDPAQLKRRRLTLARTLLADSHEPTLSLHGRVSAAFDAGYLAVLAVTGAGSAAGQEHPDANVLAAGKKLLPEVPGFDAAVAFLETRYDQPEAQLDLPKMQVWAASALNAAEGWPDPFRVKYRLSLNDAVREVVRSRKPIAEALAGLGLPDEDAAGFQQLLVNELNSLAVFNCARFRLGFKETQDWIDAGRPR